MLSQLKTAEWQRGFQETRSFERYICNTRVGTGSVCWKSKLICKRNQPYQFIKIATCPPHFHQQHPVTRWEEELGSFRNPRAVVSSCAEQPPNHPGACIPSTDTNTDKITKFCKPPSTQLTQALPKTPMHAGLNQHCVHCQFDNTIFGGFRRPPLASN